MAKSMVGLSFVKKHLPKHLHSYAHLVPSVVNDHVSWLGKIEKEEALAFGMAALNNAWVKWQQNKDAYSEAQFFSYARRCIQGIIFDQFRNAILDRKMSAQAQKEFVAYEKELKQQEAQDIERAKAKPDHVEEGGPDTQSRRNLTGLLQFSTQDRHEAFAEQWGDFSGGYEFAVADDDGDQGYVSHSPLAMNLSNAEKLRLLLPDREARLLRLLATGASLTSVCDEWEISIPRGSQLRKQALDRLADYLKRLAAGERYEGLLTESQKAKEVAAKKKNAVPSNSEAPEFIQFSQIRGLDPQMKSTRKMYDEENQHFAEAYMDFCQKEGLDPKRDLTDEQWDCFFDQYDDPFLAWVALPDRPATRYAPFP